MTHAVPAAPDATGGSRPAHRTDHLELLMPTTPTPADRPTESLLGPITPIRCTEPGCHWACHGVPDKYADSRARIVREHMAAEHAPTPEPSPAAVWVDGDPLMEAMAAAVYEQCDQHPEVSVTIDDPRTIAAVAATVARQLLGTTTGAGPAAVPSTAAMLSTPCDACDHTLNWHRNDVGCTVPRCVCGRFQDPVEAAALPAPADRAAVLREAAEVAVRAARACGESETGQYAASVAAGIGRDLRRLAADAAAGVQPPTTTEAHPPSVEYIAEVLEDDGVWMYLGADPDPAVASRRRASVTRRYPDAETRTVRKTTTYTVEPEPAAPAAPEETQ
ncbi:hypothetical protein ACH4MO_13890 [Streptomyces globisporus]|uniref:hypothetical protein n=1 Tax=Streptomyces globisporus TaxID=1908 RepID=UPI00379C6B93